MNAFVLLRNQSNESHPAGVVQTDEHVLDLERLCFRVLCVHP